MIRVLFICHGNICRSPMAEFVMKKLVSDANFADHFQIASAATSTEEIWNGIGDPVYPPAKAELARHGISCEGKRARQVTKADYAEYDYLIGMDSANIRNMLRIFGGDPDGKVARLLSYAGSERDISDPWYTGEFGTTYNDVLEGCTAFLQYLQQNGRIDIYGDTSNIMHMTVMSCLKNSQNHHIFLTIPSQMTFIIRGR